MCRTAGSTPPSTLIGQQAIKDGYLVLMAPSSRSYAVLNKGRTAAGRS